jgi:3-oxoacyl-[acyl-carrier protein] reductase
VRVINNAVMSSSWTGRRILVTGGSRGIGKAIIEELLNLGADVVATATNKKSVPKELQSINWKFSDYSSPNQLQTLILELQSERPFDGLVNNAGINIIKQVENVMLQDYDRLFSINLKAPYFICKALLPKMPRGGSVVNIASIWSVLSKSKRSLYSASKAGLTGLTRALAAEFGDSGIMVNSLSPGFVNTELTKRSLTREEIDMLSREIPVRRFADPAEIAKMVSFLVGPNNTYLTGQNIVVDGGLSIV